MKKLLQTWEGVQAENKWNRIFIVLLLAGQLLLAIQLFSKEAVVTIQPWTLNDEAWVTQSDASASYKEAWGFALAILFGNVTPANVDFIKERIELLLSPSIYNEVIDVLEMQAQQIKVDRVAIRFEPRFVEYEPKTGKVFVYGNSYTRGVARESEDRSERTYEFTLSVSNYLPVLEHLDTYQGRPRTESVLERLQRRDERQQERRAKQ